MTEETMKRLVDNRMERADLLDKYNMVSRVVKDFDKEGFVYRTVVKFPGKSNYEEIYPSVKEFRLMLLNVRNRLDAEIARLDKEFAEL